MSAPLRYMIVGAGGIGGLIACMMGNAGKDVTAIMRAGPHLQATRQQQGLKLKTAAGQEFLCPVRACTAEEVGNTTYDVAVVCTKAYSFDSILPLLQKATTPSSVVLPIQNSLFAGGILRDKLRSDVTVFDGCTYLGSLNSAPGEITRLHTVNKVLFGVDGKKAEKIPIVARIGQDMKDSQLQAIYTEHIRCELFKKVSLTSARSAAQIKYDCLAGPLRNDPEKLEYMKGLCRELNRIADASHFGIPFDAVKTNIDFLMNNVGDTGSTSLYRDIKNGSPQDERGELLFDVVKLARSLKIETPQYEEVTVPLGLPRE